MNTETGTDGIIHQLPREVANKIAAGEVVQRPSSVVKELLDNSIDAGASSIKIIIQHAGRTHIQVIDDGCGIAKEDIRKVFLPHHTSKIQSIEDVYNLSTMGFRGEAMASIASVAQVTLTTKRVEDDAATEIEIWGGEERRFSPAAAANGTNIIVRNLFYNIPARRAFLKTDATEFRHILTVVQQLALAYPEIAIEFIADAEVVYQLPGAELKQRIADLFGKHYRQSLLLLNEATSFVTVKGYIADPKLTKKTRGEQFLFVNKRPFQDRIISYMVQQVYNDWIASGEYPFYAIFIELEPRFVDVNVHPGKMEVKFEDERGVTNILRSVLKKTLNERYNVPQLPDPQTFSMTESFPTRFSFDVSPSTEEKGTSSFRVPSSINYPKRASFEGWTERLYAPEPPETAPKTTSAASADNDKGKPEYNRDRGFWQLHDRFILSQTKTGLCMVDQTAAHRRIIYERALNAAESGMASTQQLLFPQTIEFSASDFALLKELRLELLKMGFDIQLLSGNTAIVNGVPSDIRSGDEESLLQTLLQQYADVSAKLRLDTRHKVAVAFAIRTAIPAGKKLSQLEMETLVDQLFSCEQPYVDPMQRPTIQYIPLDEILTRFR